MPLRSSVHWSQTRCGGSPGSRPLFDSACQDPVLGDDPHQTFFAASRVVDRFPQSHRRGLREGGKRQEGQQYG